MHVLIMVSEAVVLLYCRPLFKLPARMVLYVVSLVEWMRDKLDYRKSHPMSAQYLVCIASRTRTFNCSAAQKFIGYSPVVSLEVSFRGFLCFPSCCFTAFSCIYNFLC